MTLGENRQCIGMCFPYLADGGLAEVGRADGGLYGLTGTRSPGIPPAAIA